MTDNEVMKFLAETRSIMIKRNSAIFPREIYEAEGGRYFITYGGGEVPKEQLTRLLKHKGIFERLPGVFRSKQWKGR